MYLVDPSDGTTHKAPGSSAPAPGASVFFARCPPSITEDQLLEVFKQFGTVIRVNLFKRWAAAKSSKGCGIITFRETQAAEAALELDGQHKFTDSEVPMVVEPCDADRQRAPAAGDRKSGQKGRSTHAVLRPVASNSTQYMATQFSGSVSWSPLDSDTYSHVPVHVLPMLTSKQDGTVALTPPDVPGGVPHITQCNFNQQPVNGNTVYLVNGTYVSGPSAEPSAITAAAGMAVNAMITPCHATPQLPQLRPAGPGGNTTHSETWMQHSREAYPNIPTPCGATALNLPGGILTIGKGHHRAGPPTTCIPNSGATCQQLQLLNLMSVPTADRGPYAAIASTPMPSIISTQYTTGNTVSNTNLMMHSAANSSLWESSGTARLLGTHAQTQLPMAVDMQLRTPQPNAVLSAPTEHVYHLSGDFVANGAAVWHTMPLLATEGMAVAAATVPGGMLPFESSGVVHVQGSEAGAGVTPVTGQRLISVAEVGCEPHLLGSAGPQQLFSIRSAQWAW